ncbi:glycosyltransferase [Oricola cellulosilytica]|uniref:Glycosyltransferase n=1 Tax=Oricola cellulosilytica TaxID=1429082 RepID=A0A4R0PCX4_9HYPH|nr:glycosyltransferase [Oricola cellulosilytica]TCD15136.1 glycosyltransferase [Oricola cellulosilytica]
MKIAIIGPVLPLRSGIARHTTALARELAGRNGITVSIISFARQYPRFLYPGADDTLRDARLPHDLDASRELDSINPLTWRRVIARVLSDRPDLVVIPAWTFFLAPCLGFIARSLRRQGVPVAMIVHNAEDHEAAAWKRAFSRFQLRQAGFFMTHNASVKASLERLVPGRPVSIRPHPVFDDYPPPTGTLPRRAGLELLYFGLVRPYKGLDIALRGIARSGLEDVRFTIAGEFWSGLRETEDLVAKLDLNEKVEIVPRYVSDEVAAELFHRSDAVLLPYRSATGSGVAALAQWYGRPVIASNLPGLSDVVVDGETGWLFEAGNDEHLADLLREKITSLAAGELRPNIQSSLQKYSWQSMADELTRNFAPAKNQ